MPPEDYRVTSELKYKRKEYPELTKSEKDHVYEELDKNLSSEVKKNPIVNANIGDYTYTAID